MKWNSFLLFEIKLVSILLNLILDLQIEAKTVHIKIRYINREDSKKLIKKVKPMKTPATAKIIFLTSS